MYLIKPKTTNKGNYLMDKHSNYRYLGIVK